MTRYIWNGYKFVSREVQMSEQERHLYGQLQDTEMRLLAWKLAFFLLLILAAFFYWLGKGNLLDKEGEIKRLNEQITDLKSTLANNSDTKWIDDYFAKEAAKKAQADAEAEAMAAYARQILEMQNSFLRQELWLQSKACATATDEWRRADSEAKTDADRQKAEDAYFAKQDRWLEKFKLTP